MRMRSRSPLCAGSRRCAFSYPRLASQVCTEGVGFRVDTFFLGGGKMFIIFSDGSKREAWIWQQTESTVRVAVQGACDLIDFTCIRGQWVSENCEPVVIEFAWQRMPAREVVTEADCICSKDLASRLIESLWSGEAGDEVKTLAIGAQPTLLV